MNTSTSRTRKSHFGVVAILAAAALMFQPQSAEAFWWVVAKRAAQSIAKPNPPKNSTSKPKKTTSKPLEGDWGRDRYDGYNRYHEHPDGELSPDSRFYNDRPGRRW